jgi:hypothetical protein
MRRGLLSWSEEEVPRSVLDARQEKCFAAMADNNLDALLIYTNFPRPSAVSFLTNFVPYWSQGVLLVLPGQAPVFTVSLSKRVANWIGETAHVGEIASTPNPGKELGTRLAAAEAKRIGVLELDKLPGTIIHNLRGEIDEVEIVDATQMYTSIRHPVDETEIMLSKRATEIAHTALALAKPGDAPVTASILSDIERSARMQGCEEILIDIAEDLSASPDYRRLDGTSTFANRYAVRLSVAYKGHWVRVGRTFEQDNDGVDRTAAFGAYLSDALPTLCETTPGGFATHDRVLEACIGSAPLQTVVGPINGAVMSLTARWRDDAGYWLISEPALVPADGGTAEPLI